MVKTYGGAVSGRSLTMFTAAFDESSERMVFDYSL